MAAVRDDGLALLCCDNFYACRYGNGFGFGFEKRPSCLLPFVLPLPGKAMFWGGGGGGGFNCSW